MASGTWIYLMSNCQLDFFLVLKLLSPSYQESVVQTKGMNAEVCRNILKEYKISCAEIILREVRLASLEKSYIQDLTDKNKFNSYYPRMLLLISSLM